MQGKLIRMRIDTENNDSTVSIIDFVRQDCAEWGRGRKKWWALKLCVSQMTLSHWLTGRREPNAAHLNDIYITYEEFQANKQKAVWSNWLWQNYYENRDLDGILLKTVALHLVKADGLSSRTLALLSWCVAKYKVPPLEQSETLYASLWHNKIGWLYESAGLKSHLTPVWLRAPGTLLETAKFDLQNHTMLRLYFERQQTDLGQKWFLYDCLLDNLKEKLSWRQQNPHKKLK